MADTVLTKSATDAIRSLIASGVEEKEIHDLVTNVATQESPPRSEVDLEELPIYDKDELPKGLITVPAAARKHGRSRRTIQGWIRNDRLELVGRLKGSARGGGYMVVREAELVRLDKETPYRRR